jgi:hypothetical protein
MRRLGWATRKCCFRKLALVVFVLIPCVFALQHCNVQQKEKKQMQNNPPMSDINKVMDAHAKEWMSIPGIVGCYVTIKEMGDSCIVIMAVNITDEIKKKIPLTIEGYPVEIEESGEIKPL